MQNNNNKNLIWLVAAGTGGHIFPGLNVVEEWKKIFPNSEFQFFGDRGRLEARIIPSKGYAIDFLFSGKWKGSGPIARLGAIFAVLVGTLQTLIKSFRSKPALLLSVGGYVSVPVAIACIIRRVPYFILEPNIKTGLANRLLSRFARAAFTTPGSDALRVMRTQTFDFGNPVRRDIKEIIVNPKLTKVLILGGSQGAIKLCRWAVDLASCPEFADGALEFTVQSGEINFEQTLEMAKEIGVEVWCRVLPFIDNIPRAICSADLVLARAGAMTVAELALAGMPTIFVPFPFAADNHQAINARLLVDDGAALMVEEAEANAFQSLKEKIIELSHADSGFTRRQALSEKFKKWGRPLAQEQIVRKMAELAGLQPQGKS